MNRWTSKKSFWPIAGALGGLFILAVAAPSSWRRYQSTHLDQSTHQAHYEEQEETVAAQAVVAEPVRAEVAQALELVAPCCTDSQDLAAIPDPPAQEIAVAAPPVENSLPIQQKFDLGALLLMRDTLLTIVDRLPAQEKPPAPPALTASTASTATQHPVVVTSENDRLAMLDTRPRQRFDLPSRIEIKPAVLPQPVVTLPPPPAEVAEVIEPLIRHRPHVLFKQLSVLADVPQASSWSAQVDSHLQRLTAKTSSQETDALALVQELKSLAQVGNELAMKVSDPVAQQHWLQATEALNRRLGIWQVLLDPKQPRPSPALANSQPSLMPVLGEVAALLATESNGNDWRNYLLLDRLAAASSEGVGIQSKERSQLAFEVLSRMSDPRLTEAQAAFLATPSLLSLRHQIQPWAAQQVDLDRLLALVERYEEGRELRYAAAIARLQHQLQWSSNDDWRALAEHLKHHYRGSNMRIAFSDELLNRLVPKLKPTVSPIRERIAGAKVHGQARTTTHLRVRLLPDPNGWRFRLEAFGKVFSNTQSDTWPARVRNTAKMQYDVRKVIVINRQGLVTSPAKATAKGRHELIGVDSQLDSVPLFGSLLREIARSKNKKSHSKAMAQVKAHVARQARQRMDKEADPKLINLEQKFRDHVLAPMSQLALLADPLAIYTTPDRAVMQLRLANEGQLGAHTPRPLAPADSVASMQLHETVLNNALAGLGLEGRRMKLPELFRFFAEKFGDAEVALPDDLPTRTVIEFSARDAILVRCDGDHLNLTLSIRELAHGRDKIRNFRVHARFRPVLDGLAVRLVRDGSLQFSARRLKTGPRIVLHSVLGKLLPKGQTVRLIAGNLKDDPRLAGLMVTQLVIDDGWIGLALGPAHAERNAWRTPATRGFPMAFVR